MALTTVPGLWIPEPVNRLAPTVADLLIDAGGEMVAYLIRAPKTGTLRRFEFLLDAVTQAPVNGLRVSFQAVDSSGNPDGTQAQYRDITSGLTAGAWITPGLLTSDGTDTGTKRSVTAGDLFACVIEFTNFSASDSLEIRTWFPDVQVAFSGFPATRHFTSSWSNPFRAPNMSLEYDDGTFPLLMGILPLKTQDSYFYASGSTPDEVALRFKFPVEVVIGGYVIRYILGGTTRDFDVVLYDNADVALVTHSFDADATFSDQIGRQFPAATISANAVYRLTVKPTTVSGNTLAFSTVNAAAHWEQSSGGIEFYWSERTDGGAWTDVTTKRPAIGLLVTQVHDGGGSGGGGLRIAGHGGLAS